mgnify:CR=1 FL=1
MEHYLIIARSVTYAQRMQRALGQAGIRSQIYRAPRDLTDMGCATPWSSPRRIWLPPCKSFTGSVLTLFKYSFPKRVRFWRCAHDLL